MYNRYIPSADGTYRRQIVPSEKKIPEEKPPAPKQEKHEPACSAKAFLPVAKPDTSDILVLLILLLILLEGEDTDPLSLLITLAAFFLLQ